MSWVSPIQKQALFYISNTEQNATLEHFIEDHNPMGRVIWDNLEDAGLVAINDDGKLILTHKGQQIVGGR